MLRVIYLIFSEGYAAIAGSQLLRFHLSDERSGWLAASQSVLTRMI